MPYEVLARRWRPDTWKAVVGQPHVTKLLAGAIEADRVAHAFLFTGIRGVGKTTAARLLARALNCSDRKKGAEPCNKCSNCEQILSGASVDVLEIDGASNRKIDNVRDIIEAAAYRPAASAYKIYIIDEVHQLTTDAFNALLKILEEPPAHVKFVMATTEWQKLPATILSRCQRYDFRRIATDAIAAHLEHICKSDGIEIPKQALAFIAREADGSMRDAQSLLEQVAAAGGKSVDPSEVAELLGMPDQELVCELADAVVCGDASAVVACMQKLRGFAFDAERFLGDLLEVVRHVSVVTAADVQALPDSAGAAVRETAERLAGKRTALDLHRIFTSLLGTLSDLRRGAHPELVLEMGLLKAATLENVASAGEVLARLEAVAGGGSTPAAGGGGSKPATAQRKAPPPAKPTKSAPASRSVAPPEPPHPADGPTPAAKDGPGGEQAARWERFLSAAQRSGGIELYVALSTCELVGFDDSVVTIRPTLSSFRDKLKEPTMRQRLDALVAAELGEDGRIEVAGAAGAAAEGAVTLDAIKAHKSGVIEKDAVEDPVVREAVAVLGGRVNKVQPLDE